MPETSPNMVQLAAIAALLRHHRHRQWGKMQSLCHRQGPRFTKNRQMPFQGLRQLSQQDLQH